MSEKIAKLQSFLINRLQDMHLDGGSGPGVLGGVPDFDLFARDYLDFAEGELRRGTDLSRVNCVSHLKRAMDCQVETFLHYFGLGRDFKARNLGFDRKLEFLRAAGVFSGASLGRLNALRNRIEHEFVVPDVEDLEVYFDLVAAFIAVLEGKMRIMYEIDMVEEDENVPELECHAPAVEAVDDMGRMGPEADSTELVEKPPLRLWRRGVRARLRLIYDDERPSIAISWDGEAEEFEVVADPTSMGEFAYLFRVMILLNELEVSANRRHVIKLLAEAPSASTKAPRAAV